MNISRDLGLSMFFHELKSPLNTIMNTAKLIELDLKDVDEEKIRKYLSLIISQTVYLKNYISNAIELGKLQSGKEDIFKEEFDFVDILREVVDITKILIEEKPIIIKTFFPHDRLKIVSDPLKVKQIILNIASNAAKFTKAGYISFAYEILENRLSIVIEDTGIGISQDEMTRIFNPYCLIETGHERVFESSGLGLYVTRYLLDLLGGQIKIESKKGKGTKVNILLPIGR
ncbi:HAMP domain-containing sensor histidine kinase [Thermodesulfovibrio sp.]|uniref:sensor histidine kinase n=1 Tax=Thermodesulfovibrio sp. TaxID=2067987 RepID=UPI0030B258D9